MWTRFVLASVTRDLDACHAFTQYLADDTSQTGR